MTEKTASTQHAEKRLKALPISDGVACAPVRLIMRDSGEYVPRYYVSNSDIPREKERLRTALSSAAAALDTLITQVEEQVGRVQANIFLAQKMIVLDELLLNEASALIETQGLNAESACVDVLESYETRLLELDNDYLKDRASDIGEVRRRILDMLRRGSDKAASAENASPDKVSAPRIVIAEELMPGETVSLNAENTAGFVTERGGPASHVAILARALGIPAISGVTGLMPLVSPGDRALLNGSTGELVLNPTRRTLNLYPALGRAARLRLQTAPPVPGFAVCANINTADEVDLVMKMDADGIGLYRTEFEFILADRILSEEEQYERYAHVVRSMSGRPVCLRLADLGGDKAARFLNLPPEENPALGYRGARLLLGQSELLAAQARAIARASRHGPVRVIYPMVVDEQQFLKVRALFMQHIADIDAGDLQHGVMFEVPAACICARSLLDAADFGSIGSNDLVQYLFAVDRDNGLVADDYNPDRPAFWELIEHIATTAEELGRPLALCGEMGGQPQFLPKLIACGIRSVSVSPRLIGLARVTARRAQHLFGGKDADAAAG